MTKRKIGLPETDCKWEQEKPVKNDDVRTKNMLLLADHMMVEISNTKAFKDAYEKVYRMIY